MSLPDPPADNITLSGEPHAITSPDGQVHGIHCPTCSRPTATEWQHHDLPSGQSPITYILPPGGLFDMRRVENHELIANVCLNNDCGTRVVPAHDRESNDA